MQESVKLKTIDEYIGTCSEEIQPKLRKLRQIILDVSPELTEKISWNMPTFYFKGNVIHFAAHKRHIGLYCVEQKQLKSLVTYFTVIRLPMVQSKYLMIGN